MELNDYKKQAKELEVELSGGQKLGVEYYVNYLTVPKIEELNKIMDKENITVGEFDVAQVCAMLKSVDITQGGKPVPFGTEDEKSAVLRSLSTQDVARILMGVTSDIAGETKNDLTDSADG